MTKDEIIRMAQESGFNWPEIHTTTIEERLERFANLVAAHKAKFPLAEAYRCGYEAGVVAEREACAALAEKTICDRHIPTGVSIYGTRAAKAIRARALK